MNSTPIQSAAVLASVELWRAIPSTNGVFEASSYGRVRRIHGARGFSGPRIMSQFSGNNGYLRVSISLCNVARMPGVHRLVCEAFHGPAPTSAHCAAHIDGTRTNNTPDNLRWSTCKENEADKLRHGTRAIGSNCGPSKLDEVTAEAALLAWWSGVPIKKLAEQTGVNRTTIRKLVCGLSWAHVRRDVPRKVQRDYRRGPTQTLEAAMTATTPKD